MTLSKWQIVGAVVAIVFCIGLIKLAMKVRTTIKIVFDQPLGYITIGKHLLPYFFIFFKKKIRISKDEIRSVYVRYNTVFIVMKSGKEIELNGNIVNPNLAEYLEQRILEFIE